MKFFIDTANVEEIREAAAMGIIAGVTTNPSLIAKEGRDYMETLKEITTIVDGPISGEVKASTTTAEGMIEEGRVNGQLMLTRVFGDFDFKNLVLNVILLLLEKFLMIKLKINLFYLLVMVFGICLKKKILKILLKN